MPDFSERISRARKVAGLSQSQAAEAWGVPKRTLEQWEQGRRKPRGLALTALEKILCEIETQTKPSQ